MPNTFAIPDLHGRLDLLEKALDFCLQQDAKKIVLLGDYVDRGPESAAVLEFLSRLPVKLRNTSVIPLRG